MVLAADEPLRPESARRCVLVATSSGTSSELHDYVRRRNNVQFVVNVTESRNRVQVQASLGAGDVLQIGLGPDGTGTWGISLSDGTFSGQCQLRDDAQKGDAMSPLRLGDGGGPVAAVDDDEGACCGMLPGRRGP